jgi:hypothetical protein
VFHRQSIGPLFCEARCHRLRIVRGSDEAEKRGSGRLGGSKSLISSSSLTENDLNTQISVAFVAFVPFS